jgi:hypothetical protein
LRYRTSTRKVHPVFSLLPFMMIMQMTAMNESWVEGANRRSRHDNKNTHTCLYRSLVPDTPRL